MALTKVSGSILKDPLNLGEVSIGGTLTYEDVTNVDSLGIGTFRACLLYTSPSPRDDVISRMPSSA